MKRSWRPWGVVLAFAFGPVIGPATAWPGDVPRTVFSEDFDGPGATDHRWTTAGPARVARVLVDESPSRPIAGVEGHALEVRADGPCSVTLTSDLFRPDFASGSTFVVRVRAALSPEGAPASPVVLEVRFLSVERRAWWWRKVDVAPGAWRTIRVDLADFRPAVGTAPTWEEVDRLAIGFRGPSRARIDGVEVLRGPGPGAAYLSTDRLLAEAFPNRAGIRTRRREPFVVLTDSPDLSLDRVLDALTSMNQAVRRDLPRSPRPRRDVPLLIFSRRADLLGFWSRQAERLNAVIAPPHSDGYTALGIATSVVDPVDPATVRPVFVHEANHALMERVLGLGNSGEWLMEGFAVRAQLVFSKQDVRPILRDALHDPTKRMPLAELLDGRPIPTNRYWQAGSFVGWLLDDAERAANFHSALDAMRSRGSTDLNPLAKPAWGEDLPRLERSWRSWLADQLGQPLPDGPP